jgi:hypothetical protein
VPTEVSRVLGGAPPAPDRMWVLRGFAQSRSRESGKGKWPAGGVMPNQSNPPAQIARHGEAAKLLESLVSPTTTYLFDGYASAAFKKFGIDH